jgi:hypothetical protein
MIHGPVNGKLSSQEERKLLLDGSAIHKCDQLLSCNFWYVEHTKHERSSEPRKVYFIYPGNTLKVL